MYFYHVCATLFELKVTKNALRYRVVNLLNKFGGNHMKTDDIMEWRQSLVISYGYKFIRKKWLSIFAIFGGLHFEFWKNEKILPQVLRDEHAKQIWC